MAWFDPQTWGAWAQQRFDVRRVQESLLQRQQLHREAWRTRHVSTTALPSRIDREPYRRPVDREVKRRITVPSKEVFKRKISHFKEKTPSFGKRIIEFEKRTSPAYIAASKILTTLRAKAGVTKEYQTKQTQYESQLTKMKQFEETHVRDEVFTSPAYTRFQQKWQPSIRDGTFTGTEHQFVQFERERKAAEATQKHEYQTYQDEGVKLDQYAKELTETSRYWEEARRAEIEAEHVTPLEQYATYPIYKKGIGFARELRESIERGKEVWTEKYTHPKVREFIWGTSVTRKLAKFGGGLIPAPAGLIEYGAHILPGAEYFKEEPKSFVAALPVGAAVMARGTAEAFRTRPYATLGEFVGMAFLTAGIGKGVTTISPIKYTGPIRVPTGKGLIKTWPTIGKGLPKEFARLQAEAGYKTPIALGKVEPTKIPFVFKQTHLIPEIATHRGVYIQRPYVPTFYKATIEVPSPKPTTKIFVTPKFPFLFRQKVVSTKPTTELFVAPKIPYRGRLPLIGITTGHKGLPYRGVSIGTPKFEVPLTGYRVFTGLEAQYVLPSIKAQMSPKMRGLYEDAFFLSEKLGRKQSMILEPIDITEIEFLPQAPTVLRATAKYLRKHHKEIKIYGSEAKRTQMERGVVSPHDIDLEIVAGKLTPERAARDLAAIVRKEVGTENVMVKYNPQWDMWSVVRRVSKKGRTEVGGELYSGTWETVFDIHPKSAPFEFGIMPQKPVKARVVTGDIAKAYTPEQYAKYLQKEGILGGVHYKAPPEIAKIMKERDLVGYHAKWEPIEGLAQHDIYISPRALTHSLKRWGLAHKAAIRGYGSPTQYIKGMKEKGIFPSKQEVLAHELYHIKHPKATEATILRMEKEFALLQSKKVFDIPQKARVATRLDMSSWWMARKKVPLTTLGEEFQRSFGSVIQTVERQGMPILKPKPTRVKDVMRFVQQSKTLLEMEKIRARTLPSPLRKLKQKEFVKMEEAIKNWETYAKEMTELKEFKAELTMPVITPATIQYLATQVGAPTAAAVTLAPSLRRTRFELPSALKGIETPFKGLATDKYGFYPPKRIVAYHEPSYYSPYPVSTYEQYYGRARPVPARDRKVVPIAVIGGFKFTPPSAPRITPPLLIPPSPFIFAPPPPVTTSVIPPPPPPTPIPPPIIPPPVPISEPTPPPPPPPPTPIPPPIIPPFIPPSVTGLPFFPIAPERKKKKRKLKKKKQWEWLEEFTVQRPEELHFGAIESGIPKVSKVTMLSSITIADITPRAKKSSKSPRFKKPKSLLRRKTNRRAKRKK